MQEAPIEVHRRGDPEPDPAPGQPARRSAPVRLLLVNPRLPESFWSFRWWVNELYRRRAVNPPLGLATLAALCPPDWDVRILDENVESLPLDPEADLVGVCGMGVQFERQKEILAQYRARGCRVVAGGSFASLCPERFEGLADSVVAGEAEIIWKRFCEDFEAGRPRALYREEGLVRLEDSPVPRFDLLRLERYATASLQFSRGCPYLCEFCDIIVMFGRKPRHKTFEQVGAELDALRALGVRSAFFVDDNLIGNRNVARELLRYLAAYQKRHGYPFQFGTEVSINLASQPDLLALMQEARFTWVFVGIESPDPASLQEARKTQNLHEDLIASVHRLYRHGLDVLGGFIIGFDNDTVDTFELQYRFLLETGIQVAMVGMLTALPRTPLYERLEKAGRLRPMEGNDNTKPATNVIPLRMGYEEMVAGYLALYRRLTSDRAIAARVRNKMRHLLAPAYESFYDGGTQVRAAVGLALRILRGGPVRVWHFLASVPWARPGLVMPAIVDWIAGLSMRDYVERHFRDRPAEERRLQRLFARLERLAAPSLAHIRIAIARPVSAMPDISIDLRAGDCARFLRGASRHLEKVLHRTRTSVTLRVESLLESERIELQRLLARLARHGDRVAIELGEAVRNAIPLDTSVFRVRIRTAVHFASQSAVASAA